MTSDNWQPIERRHDLRIDTGRYREMDWNGQTYNALLLRCVNCPFEGVSSEDLTPGCPLPAPPNEE